MSLGDNIKKYREQRNLSQYALAKQLGISQQSIAQWEISKTSPRRKTIDKLANILSVTPNELFGYETVKTDNHTSCERNLDKLLQQTTITFENNTYELNDEDREKAHHALRLAFYEAKKRYESK